MATLVEGVRVEERRVGAQWLLTSGDLPGLYVAHADRETAWKAVPNAIRMLRQMADRRPARVVADA